MPAGRLLLLLLFGVHWAAFVWLFVRRRSSSLLLPIAVFSLLIAVQLLKGGAVSVDVGPIAGYELATVLRATAIVLAVPSIGLMGRRMVARRWGGAR